MVLSAFRVPGLNRRKPGLNNFLAGCLLNGICGIMGLPWSLVPLVSTSLSAIVSAASSGAANVLLLTIGSALILVGLGFKVAAGFRSTWWTPDVLSGCAFLSDRLHGRWRQDAGFAALFRVFALAFPSLASNLTPVIAVLPP